MQLSMQKYAADDSVVNRRPTRLGEQPVLLHVRNNVWARRFRLTGSLLKLGQGRAERSSVLLQPSNLGECTGGLDAWSIA